MKAALAFSLALTLATPADALLCQPILGCSCNVTADDLNFGSFAPIDNQPRSAEGDVDVHCTGLIELFPSILVRINGGTWGSVGDREMRRAGGSEEIDYNIYTDGGAIWGDGTGGHAGQTISGGALALGVWDVSATMNGEMPAAPAAPPGTYSDTLIVRIDW